MTTEDVADQCVALAINSEQQLVENDIISDNISVLEAGSRLGEALRNSIYINPNVVPCSKPSNCAIYAAALPAEFAGSFPEGTVLQIIPDTALLAMSSGKATSNADTTNNSLVFKDASFSLEMETNDNNLAEQNTLTMSSMANELGEQVTQVPEITVSTEGNISDIDLSFLTETEDASAIPDVRNLNESAVPEYQESLSDSLQMLQSNLNLVPQEKKNETDQVVSELAKDTQNSDSNVVMIDVTNPIQLSQNSLIVVNGQKCVLQHDSQTGLVVAYPVKEPEKPKRRRGRPRKICRNDVKVSTDVSESADQIDTDNTSDTDIEKGLLDMVNDEGALVRRSSRKRKVAKVLRDYETGNLKQELGSDVEETEIGDKDGELKKKKHRGPGRPRKYHLEEHVEPPVQEPKNTVPKRPRGRPRKYVAESEPTQAFLVQTADGKNLMMHMPLSSIPPGVTLQEVAQDIANKLNIGLNQSENRTGHAESIVTQTNAESILEQQCSSNIEPAVQDHSVGSTTTTASDIAQLEFQNFDNTENVVDSTSQEVTITSSDITAWDPAAEPKNKEFINEKTGIPQSICDKVKGFMDVENISETLPEETVQVLVSNTDSVTSEDLVSNSQSDNIDNQFSLNDKLNDHMFTGETVTALSSTESMSSSIKCNSITIPSELLFNSDLLKERSTVSLLISSQKPLCTTSPSFSMEKMVTEGTISLGKDTNKDINSSDFTDVYEDFSQSGKYSNLKNSDSVFHSCESDAELVENNVDSHLEESSLSSVQNIRKEIENDHKYDTRTSQKKTFISSDEQYNQSISISLLDTSKIAQKETIVATSQTCENMQILTDVKRKRGRPRKNVSPSEKDAVKPFPKMTSILLPPSSIGKNSTSTNSALTSATVFSVSDKVFPMILPKQENSVVIHQCKCCQFPFSSQEDLVEHFKEKHPRCICNICNYMGENPYSIKRHSYRHSNNGCFCHICKKVYKDHYILKMHMKMVHMPADVLFCCQVCNKKFTRKAHLKRHLRTHDPDKPFKCYLCDYRGCEKSDITKHMVIHEAPKHQCELCNKTFRHIKNKELHIKRHKGQRDYKCGICDFYGYTFTDIRKHIERKHTNSKLIICDICGQACKTFELLKEHQMSPQCQSNALQQELHNSENTEIHEDCIQLQMIEDVPINILGEQEQAAIATYDAASLTAIQNSHLVIDGILSTQNGEIVVNGLDENGVLAAENFSLVSTEVDSKEITLVATSEGEHLKPSPVLMSNLPLETTLSIDEGAGPDMFSLCSIETEVSATQDIDSTTS